MDTGEGKEKFTGFPLSLLHLRGGLVGCLATRPSVEIPTDRYNCGLRRAPLPDDPVKFMQHCVADGRVRWTYHVAMRLEERNLQAEILIAAVDSFEVIESYPEDKYLPSYLLRAQAEDLVLHAQIATDVLGNNVRIVTLYAPEPALWDETFRRRRDCV